MRLAILTNDYPPTPQGGSGVVAETQARELEKRGHEVKVFLKKPALGKKPAVSRLFFHLMDLRANKKLATEILDWQPDILLSHNLTGCGFGTPRKISQQGIKWVHLLHDVQLIEPSGKIIQNDDNYLRRLWRWKWSLTRRFFLGRPDLVISPTRWLLDFHQRHGFFINLKSEIVPNPIFLNDGQTGAREPAILFVGRLDFEKGIDVLLAAWRELGERRPRLTIVGDGQGLAALRKRHEPALNVLGPKSHTEVLDLMLRHAVVAVPSLIWENQPTVILEALAAGCRVVATNVGGIPETLNGAGWTVPPADSRALSLALNEALRMATDPVREEARRQTLEIHRVEAAVGRLESLLKSNL